MKLDRSVIAHVVSQLAARDRYGSSYETLVKILEDLELVFKRYDSTQSTLVCMGHGYIETTGSNSDED